jgi:hypothetical protein
MEVCNNCGKKGRARDMEVKWMGVYFCSLKCFDEVRAVQ